MTRAEPAPKGAITLQCCLAAGAYACCSAKSQAFTTLHVAQGRLASARTVSMNAIVSHARRINAPPALLALLMLALFLRLWVPAGYMIAPTAAGWPALTLCPGTTAPVAAAPHYAHHSGMAHHGSSHQHEPGHDSNVPCAYSALAAPVLPPSPPAIDLAALLPAAPPLAAPLRAQSVRTLAAPPPPATGPPPSA